MVRWLAAGFMTILVHAVHASPVSNDFVTEVALTFRANNDSAGFMRLMNTAKSLQSPNPDVPYETEIANLKERIKGNENIGKFAVDVLLPEAGPAFDHGYQAIAGLNESFARNVGQLKWGADITNAELEQMIRNALDVADKHNKLNEVIDSLSKRWDTNIAKGEFPDAVMAAMTNEETRKGTRALLGEMDENIKLSRSAADNSAEGLAIGRRSQQTLGVLQKRIDEQSKAIRAFLGQRAREKEESADENKRNYLKAQAWLENQQLGLNIFCAFAQGNKDLESAVALGQLYISTSSAYNKFKYSKTLSDAELLTMPDPALVLAANWTTAALAAFQVLGGRMGGESAVTSGLSQIFEALKAIDQKLDYIIDLTRSNFKHVVTLEGQNAFVLGQILEVADDTNRMQYRDEALGYVKDAMRQVSDIQSMDKLCTVKDDSFCRADENYQRMMLLLNDQLSMKFPVRSDAAANLPMVTLPLTDDSSRHFNRYDANRFSLGLVQNLMADRAAQAGHSPEHKDFFASMASWLASVNDSPNAEVWSAAVDAVTRSKSKMDSPPKLLKRELQKQGRQLLTYYQTTSHPSFHIALNLDLQYAAMELNAGLKGLVERTIDRFVSKFNETGATPPKVIDTTPGWYPPDGDAYVKEALSDFANPGFIQEILYKHRNTRQYGYYVLLEKLGLGRISKTGSIVGDCHAPLILRYYFTWTFPDLARKMGLLGPTATVDQFLTMSAQLEPHCGAYDIDPTHYLEDRLGVGIQNEIRLVWNRDAGDDQDRFRQTFTASGRDDDKNIQALRAVIWYQLSNLVADEFSAIERLKDAPPPVADYEKNPVVTDEVGAIEALRREFQGYRLRFYLFQFLVQQAKFDGRIGPTCAMAVSRPVGLQSATPYTAHPLALIARLRENTFETITIQQYVRAVTRADDGSLACRFHGLPKDVIRGLTELDSM